MNESIIQISGINMTFSTRKGSLTALEDFNLKVRSGEVVCIVGASGFGKSTFLNIIAGFLRPSAGEALLDGQPILRVEPRYGMIFQNYVLFPWMTVLDNVGFGPRLNGVSRRERLERARHWVSLVG